MTESIVFNGRRYHLCEFYYRCIKTNTRLHRDVWEYYSGKKIPKGYHIHHIDGNKLNNNFDNLECISSKEHRRKHSEEMKAVWKRPEMIKANEIGREKCKIWHASDKGKEWHSKHQKEYMEKIIIIKTCPECKNEFRTFNNQKEQTFCKRCRDKFLKRKLRADKKALYKS